MDNGNPSRIGGSGRRRVDGARRGSHRAGSRGSGPSGAGRHRASGLDLPFNADRRHVAVAVAGCLVVAAGIAIGTSLFNDDEPASSAGNEEHAPLLYSNGEAVPDDFTERHRGLVDRAYAELETRYGITAEELYDAETNPGGYRAALTIDQGLQEAAEETSPAAVVAVEPGSGEVLCYYGGEDPEADQVDAPHPPSSVFDMVTAATALEDGASIESWWPDEEADITLAEAVRENRDPAIDAIAEQYGADAILGTAIGMGVTEMTDDEGAVHTFEDGEAVDPGAFEAADFGSYAVSVLDMATVYATIANDGVHAETHVIDRVINGSGNTVQASQGIRTAQAVNTSTARDLQFVGLGNGEPIDDRDFFGLGGTWNDEPAQSWYVGAIPQLTVAAWVGHEDSGEPVWRQVVDSAIDVMGYEPKSWPGAANAGSDLTDGIQNDDGSIDPDSAYCRANPDAAPCAEGEEETSEEPSEEPSSEDPPDEPSDEPTSEDPPEEPSDEPTEPSEEPTDDDCHWLDPSC